MRQYSHNYFSTPHLKLNEIHYLTLEMECVCVYIERERERERERGNISLLHVLLSIFRQLYI